MRLENGDEEVLFLGRTNIDSAAAYSALPIYTEVPVGTAPPAAKRAEPPAHLDEDRMKRALARVDEIIANHRCKQENLQSVDDETLLRVTRKFAGGDAEVTAQRIAAIKGITRTATVNPKAEPNLDSPYPLQDLDKLPEPSDDRSRIYRKLQAEVRAHDERQRQLRARRK